MKELVIVYGSMQTASTWYMYHANCTCKIEEQIDCGTIQTVCVKFKSNTSGTMQNAISPAGLENI